MRLEEEIRQARFKSARHKLALNLMFTGNWLHGHSVRRFKPHGLSPQQYNILRILRGQHPKSATVQLIKERMLDRMSNVSRLVEKLRLKGLVDRSVCPSDRRAVDVCITRKGLDLLSALDRAEDEYLTLFDALDEAEVAHLNTLLDKLRG